MRGRLTGAAWLPGDGCLVLGARSKCLADERGAALVIVLLLGVLLGVAGASLLTLSTTEVLIGASYRHSVEASFAAEAGLERALQDLAHTADWSLVLRPAPGNLVSSFVDGTLTPRTPAGRLLDLAALTAARQRDSDARDGPDTYGADNPQWRLYAHAPLAGLLPGATHVAAVYLVVWVADDGGDGDGDASADSNHRVVVRSEAFGTGGTRRAVEATIGRSETGVIRSIAWREVH